MTHSLRLILVTMQLFACVTIQTNAQIYYDYSSTRDTDVLTYQSNFGVSLVDPRSLSQQFYPGLIYPRNEGHSYVFASGVWIGGLTYKPDEQHLGKFPNVLKTFDLLLGTSMCVPGDYSNGNRYREDLRGLYLPIRNSNSENESLEVSFHDGDLRQYPNFVDPNRPDTTYWLNRCMPLGFQFRQHLTTWKSSLFSNCAMVSTECVYNGAVVLDSVYVAGAVSVAIGRADDVLQAFKHDTCWTIDMHDGNPIVVCGDAETDTEQYGRIGVCEIQQGNASRKSIVKILDYSSIESIDHYYNYRLISSDTPPDAFLAGDRFILYSKFIGTVNPGDRLNLTMAFVMTTTNDKNPDSLIASRIESLRELVTSVDDHGERSNRIIGLVVDKSGHIDLSDYFGFVSTDVELYSAIGTVMNVQLVNGIAILDDVSNGLYYVISRGHHFSKCVPLVVAR